MAKYRLFTTHCPKCKILEKKLQDKNIEFEICEDTDEMKSIGITSVPVLMCDDQQLSFYDAIKLVNTL